ncbi:hypothetical protein PPACK8108_LOCUS24913 [Phakopsora pachyrhizi]|uniref:Uncharacterized protein n=1 Tax=Phakopsora pachyrhizi TaxID=170000 RepID=A0AAV0BTZ4_PHAPC|nr:hypothetical protein PPACK8108_LOCUS24913 [Phakopsora pachyrhizi]
MEESSTRPESRKEVKGGLKERYNKVFDKEVAGEGNEWHLWKEEQKLGGGAHQGQSDWRKITGATDLKDFQKEERRVSRGYQGERKWCLATLKVFERETRPLCEHKEGFLFLFLNPGRMSGLGGTEAGIAGPSRSETTIRKVVKIPKEEELMFDGKGFHQFLDMFEMAAENEGAGD